MSFKILSTATNIWKPILMTICLAIFSSIVPFLWLYFVFEKDPTLPFQDLLWVTVTIFYPIFTMIGVVIIKKLLREKGSILFGIVGTIIGALIGFLGYPYIILIVPLIITPILCMVGFYLKVTRASSYNSHTANE